MIISAARNVLITGAAKRIGRTLALELAEAGWNVGLHYRKSELDAETLIQELRTFGVHVVGLAADLSVESEVIGLFEKTAEALGPLTGLVNNAAIFEEDSAATATRSSWDRHMEVNVRAPFVLSQQLAAALPAKELGSIVNIIDQRVWNPSADFTSYTLSKMALWGCTQVLAKSFAPRVRVNAIGPGPTLQSVHQSPEEFAAEVGAVPLKRKVTPKDISRGVKFIMDSPTMTGQMIALDSGQHLGCSSKQAQTP